MSSGKNGLKIQRIAGGSIVDRIPLFSPDGELLFIPRSNIVSVYSTVTGQWLRDLEGPENIIVNIHYDLFNSKVLIACTETGEIYIWKWKSGVFFKKSILNFHSNSFNVITFDLIDLHGDNSIALIAWQEDSKSKVQIDYFDLQTGEILTDKYLKSLNLSEHPVKISVGPKHLKYFVIAQHKSLYAVFIKQGKWNKLWSDDRPKEPTFTLVKCHPSELSVLTGDFYGRLRLWRNLNGSPVYTLFHWHSTKVLSATFSVNGSFIYSGGMESVLVKWDINDPMNREFIPRIATAILHIAISPNNQRISVSTHDNGIRIYNSNRCLITVIQNFTRTVTDETERNPFPAGLKINPRTTSLVLNGRDGYLQFYSTHTRSLLYNMDITQENFLMRERGKIMINSCVNKTAITMNWMASAELFDDTKHEPHTKLKFWYFNQIKQQYELNTNIEMPHWRRVTGLEFSNLYYDENLLCASTGGDNFIKIWGLIESENIYRKGKFWHCIARANYKNLPIYSLSFSQDGSILASGCGNTLCVWTSDNLKLKCALSTPAALDGSTNKMLIKIPKNLKQGNGIKSKDEKSSPLNNSQLLEKRKLLQQQIRELIKSNDKTYIKNINKDEIIKRKRLRKVSISSLNIKEKEMIVKKLIQANDLNVYQKFELFSFLRLGCKTTSNDIKSKLENIILKKHIEKKNLENNLQEMIRLLYKNKKFIEKSKFKRYQKRKFNQSGCISFTRFFNNIINPKNEIKMNGNTSNEMDDEVMEEMKNPNTIPIKVLPSIKYVLCCSGEFSHLVVVCTENRLLIWNLLTLKLQSSYKLSINHITIDPYTCLIAAFTINNDLYVFMPNVPIPLYSRKNMPMIYGAAWVPRRISRQKTLNLDWQSVSQLFFLNKDQELLCLISENDPDVVVNMISLASDNPQAMTPFGSALSQQIELSKIQQSNVPIDVTFSSIGNVNTNVCDELINLSPHTMCPVNKLCKDFIFSLSTIKNEKISLDGTSTDKKEIVENNINTKNSLKDAMDDDEDFDGMTKIKIENRKKLINQDESKKLSIKEDSINTDIEIKLMKISKQKINIGL